jgi:hypothetical protein
LSVVSASTIAKARGNNEPLASVAVAASIVPYSQRNMVSIFDLILGLEMTCIHSEKRFAMSPTLSACIVTKKEMFELVIKRLVK